MCSTDMCEHIGRREKCVFVILLHLVFFMLDIGKTFKRVKKLLIQELTWKHQVLIILANANQLI